METKKDDILCSIAFPTRYRTEGVRHCLSSVLTTCAFPRKIEFVLRIDDDDKGMAAAMPTIVEMVHACRSHITVLSGPRLPDPFQEMFVKLMADCCAHCRGRWIWQMEDDAVVMPSIAYTPAWDFVLGQHDPEDEILCVPETNIYNWQRVDWQSEHYWHTGHFPIMPNGWWKRFGMDRIQAPCDTFTLNFLTGMGYGGDKKGKGWKLQPLAGLTTFHVQKEDKVFTEKGRTTWG